jgi:DNA-binding transcriptional regulator YiaG
MRKPPERLTGAVEVRLVRGHILGIRDALLIVEARRRAGLSQRELALRLGKRQAEIARWERGHDVAQPLE